MRISISRLLFVCGFAIFFVLIGHTIYQHYHPSPLTKVTLCGFIWDSNGKNPQPIKVTMEPDLILAQSHGMVITLRLCSENTDFRSLSIKDFEPMLAALR